MTVPHSNRRQEVGAGVAFDQLKSRPIYMDEVLSGLSSTDIEIIMKMAQDRRYDRRTYVYLAGERSQGLYLTKMGLIEEFRLTETGIKLPISQIAPGQLFGLSSVDGRYCCSAEAIEESVVSFLPFEKLEDICQDFSTVAYNLVQLLIRRVGEIGERLQLLVFSGLRARVAWSLLGLSVVHGPILFNTTHETLATWAAGSRPKVSRVLEELQQAGIIRLARGEIRIRDSKRLAEWAKQASLGSSGTPV